MATKTSITWEQFVAAGVEGQQCEWVDGEILRFRPRAAVRAAELAFHDDCVIGVIGCKPFKPEIGKGSKQ